MTKNAYMQPDEKKRLSKYYGIAHNIAKQFCKKHDNADSHEIYTFAETAARLYYNNESIQTAKSAKEFIEYKIESSYERKTRNMTHAEQFKPISEEIKRSIVDDAKAGTTNVELTKKYNISSSSVTRILQKAGVIDPPTSRKAYTEAKRNKKTEKSIKKTHTVNKIKDSIPTIVLPDITPEINEPVKTNESTYDLGEMFISAKTKTNDAENLSHIIHTLGLMISDKLTSISIQYNLNGNNVKIKIEHPET